MIKSTDQALADPSDIPPEVRTYLESLLAESGAEFTAPADKETKLREVYQELDRRLIDTVIDYLPADKLAGFMQFMQQNPTRPQIDQYLQLNLPDAADVFIVAFADFRDAYLKDHRVTA